MLVAFEERRGFLDCSCAQGLMPNLLDDALRKHPDLVFVFGYKHNCHDTSAPTNRNETLADQPGFRSDMGASSHVVLPACIRPSFRSHKMVPLL